MQTLGPKAIELVKWLILELLGERFFTWLDTTQNLGPTAVELVKWLILELLGERDFLHGWTLRKIWDRQRLNW
jgi:hypothetical protein